MTAKDAPAILKFAQALPIKDLLFLRADLTQPEAVDDWVTNVETVTQPLLFRMKAMNLLAMPPFTATMHLGLEEWVNYA